MDARELLRGLAAADETCLTDVLASDAAAERTPSLDRSLRLLVELAALLVIDAPTATVRWAAERAGVAGVGDEQLVAVLLAAGPTVGGVQTVTSAPRLALALDLEPELRGWDGD